MSKKVRLGLIFGGRSGEHEVSIRSARSVMAAIDKSVYDVVPIAIDKKGSWLSRASSHALLNADPVWKRNGRARVRPDEEEASSGGPTTSAIIADPARPGLTTLSKQGKALKTQRLDVVFPLLHGTFGEDGTIQGLLEMACLPYVGCGVLASACGMDKVTMKALFQKAGLPICEYTWFLRSAWESQPQSILRQIVRQTGFPCFVKPANLGSSVGISRATDRRSLQEAIDLAALYDRKIVVEKGINAREIECAVLGNDQPEASLPGEYVIYDERARFLDYAEKYSNTGRVEFVVPAPLKKSMTQRVQKLAIKAFQSIDGAGIARVDFFLDRDSGDLYVNELNTMPGLTDVSGYPKMWSGSGLNFTSLINRLIDLALERHREKSRNVTTLS